MANIEIKEDVIERDQFGIRHKRFVAGQSVDELYYKNIVAANDPEPNEAKGDTEAAKLPTNPEENVVPREDITEGVPILDLSATQKADEPEGVNRSGKKSSK